MNSFSVDSNGVVAYISPGPSSYNDGIHNQIESDFNLDKLIASYRDGFVYVVIDETSEQRALIYNNGITEAVLSDFQQDIPDFKVNGNWIAYTVPSGITNNQNALWSMSPDGEIRQRTLPQEFSKVDIKSIKSDGRIVFSSNDKFYLSSTDGKFTEIKYDLFFNDTSYTLVGRTLFGLNAKSR